MEYKYQLHIHTAACSLCGKLTPADLCQALLENGYQGTVITNHFLHGNTALDRTLPWEDFVRAYEEDYLACKEEGDKHDLDILFGIEEVVFPGLELLCYGLKPEVLYAHPELRDAPIQEWTDIMRANGVVLIQAHPYRKAGYIPSPGPLPIKYYDGVEIYNSGNSEPEQNLRAIAYAKENPHLITTSSADAHWAGKVGYGGIITTARIRTPEELAHTLRTKAFTPILPEEYSI